MTESPLGPGPPVRATSETKSARVPLVMKIFEPLMTQSPPSRRAVVRIAATSDPAPGSLMPIDAIFSPRMAGARNSRFCSGVPRASMTERANSMWARRPTAVPTLPHFTSSWARISVYQKSSPAPPYSGA